MRAESFRKDGKFDQAITEYQAYIDERLKRKDFPPDQSPYFYYLLIGDSYVGLGRPDDAEKAYLTALDNGTEQSLVAGKMRALADWFETRGEYETAIELLQRHHNLDPLLYNIEIDQLHKKLIEAEDKKEKKESAPNEPLF